MNATAVVLDLTMADFSRKEGCAIPAGFGFQCYSKAKLRPIPDGVLALLRVPMFYLTLLRIHA